MAIPVTGGVKLSGLDDEQLIIMIEAKRTHPRMQFNPSTMQSVQVTEMTGGRHVPSQVYNNAELTWTDTEGLKSVHDLLGKLIHHNEHKSS